MYISISYILARGFDHGFDLLTGLITFTGLLIA